MRVLLALLLVTSVAHAELDKPAIRREVKRHLGSILACFEKHGQTDARVMVDFVIAVDGRVTSATSDARGDKPLRDCVAGVFKRLTFPASPTATKVTYPVHIIVAGP